LLDKIRPENMDQWISVIDKQQNLLDDLPMLNGVQPEEIAARLIDIQSIGPQVEKNIIKEHLFLGKQQATIPGSSLKGSLRTVILNKLIRQNAHFLQKEYNLKDRGRFNDTHLMAEYMGKETYYDRRARKEVSKYSANKDFMRFLRVSDFYFNTNTCLIKSNVINLFRDGWSEKKELSSFWECIPKGATTEGNIQIPKELMREVQKKNYIRNNKLELIDIARIFRMVNEHTLRLLETEIEFWKEEEEDYQLDIGDYLTEIQTLKKSVEDLESGSCILRVGAGAGWDFMTGGWAKGKDSFGDYMVDENVWVYLKRQLRSKRYSDDMLFPKTRKLLEGGEPLGFVKMSL